MNVREIHLACAHLLLTPISWNANIESLNRPSAYRPSATYTILICFRRASQADLCFTAVWRIQLTICRKDKTLVEILDRLKSLEGGLRNLDGKVDSLNARGTLPMSIYGLIQPPPPPPAAVDAGRPSTWQATNVHLQTATIPPATPRDVRYVSATHKMLSWPFIQQILENKVPGLDLASLEKDGAAVLLGLQSRTTSLPTNIYESTHIGAEGTSLPLQVAPASRADELQAEGLSMDWETIQRLTKSYFDTFNLIYPIMDRQLFQSEVLPAITSHGLDESSSSTLACLIFALGEVAISAVQGQPIGVCRISITSMFTMSFAHVA